MDIKEELLSKSKYNRSGTKRAVTTKIAWHWVGNAKSSAIANRNYFESLKAGIKNASGNTISASAHYIIGLNGEIIRCVPEDEIAYTTNSANSYSIGIETCHLDWNGAYSEATYKSMVELGAYLCKKYNLNPNNDFIRHYDITKKVCPKWFVDHPNEWARFKQEVGNKLESKAEWVHDEGDNRWWYRHGDGSYTKGDWELINNRWYLFDTEGYMCTGLVTKNGESYYLCDDEAQVEGACMVTDGRGVLKIWGVE